MADGGTLFLDEVGELPPPLQAQLLRAVQERTYKRVGGNNWQTTNFRLVSATNRDLRHEVEQGRFRADLYYRLATCTCRLPPLRARTEDIIPLATHFLSEMLPGHSIELDPAVREYILSRPYPGNIRELKQLVCRIAYRHTGEGRITPGDVPENERPCAEPLAPDWRRPALEEAVRRGLSLGVDLKEISRAAVETAIRIAVEEEGGSLQRAARRLGITDRALQMRRAMARESGGKARAEAAGA
jgi:transcriptional regulator with GAF, ATPase, and Fis domain